MSELDNTHKNGTKCIDAIAASDNIMSFIEGCILCETNEIIDTNYRGYMVDIDLNTYFDEDFSMWDEINRSLLDSGKRSYRERFAELIDKELDSINK